MEQISTFDLQCKEAEDTDTGEVWSMLNDWRQRVSRLLGPPRRPSLDRQKWGKDRFGGPFSIKRDTPVFRFPIYKKTIIAHAPDLLIEQVLTSGGQRMSSVFRSVAFGGLIATLLSPVALSADQAPSLIEVFTMSDQPAMSGQVEGMIIYEVDGLDQLTASLSKNLPNDEEAAKDMALQRIARLGDELRWTVEHAVEGMTRAKTYDLQKLPAVVFDQGENVVYGVVDLDQALALYHEAANR